MFQLVEANVPKGIQRGNREVKKPKKDAPKKAGASYRSETAALMGAESKLAADRGKKSK
jgi:hypothetical protein